MAAEIVQKAGEDVGKLMGDFTIEYIKALINSKLEGAMDEACETVIPSGLAEAAGGGDDEAGDDAGDDVVESKGDDEKEQGKPIAAGAQLVGYKLGTGPDRVPRRYYNVAAFAIKPVDSVIVKSVKRHGQLTKFFKSFPKNCPEFPKDAPAWPKKKMMGKNPEYYRNRYKSMDEYFVAVTSVQEVTVNENFLKYFDLQYDEKRAANLEIFTAAVASLCENYGINFDSALSKAQKLGFDADEAEMLKVVAVEKIGSEASEALISQLNEKMPDVVPAKVKNKFQSTTEGKLAGVIATAVEAGWTAAKEAFAKIVEKLNEVLDKGMDKVKELLMKALEPIGKVVKEKFAKAEAKTEVVDDGLDKKLNIARFPPLKAALESIQGGGKAAASCKEVIAAIDQMKECHKFVGYLMYNLGDPEYGQYIPFLNEIQDNHYRLTIGLTDMAHLLSRAAARGFLPLCEYADKLCDGGFDANEHKKNLPIALRECGRKLTMDYFDLPRNCRRMTRWLPDAVTKQFLKLGQTTICQTADLLGQMGANWMPTSKDDAKETFVKTLAEPLDSFIEQRVKLWTTIVRRASEKIISDQFMSTVGDTIDEICNTLNELCAALPDPLGENLKAGDIVKYLFDKLTQNAVVFAVKMMAKSTEAVLYDVEKFADEKDKAMVRRLRYEPFIRPDDFDPAEPEDDGGDDKDKDDANAKPNPLEKQLTQENTPDSDDENDPASPKAGATAAPADV